MPYRRSSLQTHNQQYQCKYDGYTYLFAVKPIVMFAVNANEDNTEQPKCPHNSTKIINTFKRNVRALTVIMAHAEINQRKNKNECTYRYAVHRLPVKSINTVTCSYIYKLNATENKREKEWKEYGKIPLRSNLQLNITPTYKCSYNLKKPLTNESRTTSGKKSHTMHT